MKVNVPTDSNLFQGTLKPLQARRIEINMEWDYEFMKKVAAMVV